MIELDTVLRLIRPRMKRILDFGELALAPAQFVAFRKLVLDEFGRSGLESELERAFREHLQEHSGTGRPTPQRKEVRHV
jgi:hypothetical protein